VEQSQFVTNFHLRRCFQEGPLRPGPVRQLRAGHEEGFLIIRVYFESGGRLTDNRSVVSPNTTGLRNEPQQGNGRSSLDASLKTVCLRNGQDPVRGEAALSYKTRDAGRRLPRNLFISSQLISNSHFYPGNFSESS